MKSLDIELQMAVVIKTSLASSIEEIDAVLLEQELNWAEPAEDGPTVLSNILDVFTGRFFGVEGGWVRGKWCLPKSYFHDKLFKLIK